MTVPRFQLSSFNFQPPPQRRSGGFALLITITLLAFVVLLLVGLAAYTRVETAISGNTQKQAQARQNALLALDVALGQLQRHAGPDQRVTATAEGFNGVAVNPRYTGVWDARTAGAEPLTWLVSGNETNPLTVSPGTVFTATNGAELLGLKSTLTANNVRAPLVPITTVGVPGLAANAPIGRYAWWVGDQGVKAPVALAGSTDAITYPPFDSPDLRDRIRQQISLGAGATDATGDPVFEPRAANNATNAANTTAFNQLAFLNLSTTGTVGLPTLRNRYHDWTPNNFNVLANTADGGLRRDLSLDPSLLGPAAQAWLDYPSYMEDPAASAKSAFPPSPAFTSDPLRRRYAISATGARVAPVLTYFYLLFGARKQTAAADYTLSLRWAAALWNPYSGAFLPEDLKLEISGLPTSLTGFTRDPATLVETDQFTVSMRQLYGSDLKFTLPWTPTVPPFADQQSWLPGRVHNWAYKQNATFLLNGDNPGVFNTRDLGGFADGLLTTVPGSSTVNGNSQFGVRLGSSTITVKLTRDNGEVLATYTSPSYDSVIGTAPGDASNTTSQLGFIFRLAESFDTPVTPGVWLNNDPRSLAPPSGALIAVPNGTNPADYVNYITISNPDRLLDRATNSTTYNEDVPVFELPRAPLLSLGTLQHLALDGSRPFSIGNSWGATIPLNGIRSAQLFDQFFFSGLVPAVMPPGSGPSLVLPNPLLRVSPRKADGTATTVADLRDATNATSSQFLLQGGAFNLNSTSPTAWAAVLRGVRFPAPAQFNYLAADVATGTAADTGETAAFVQSPDAQFFRFSQSAQETYQAEPNPAAGTTTASTANTHLFRRGVITLDAAKVTALAAAITAAIKARHSDPALGPFRSLEEFLSPVIAGGTSLLEDAIAAAAINVDPATNAPIEFSSQFLTQGDIMTALAPVLFPRSDTFVIRTYGEAVNPATDVAEGRAWCEAIVQRVPDYFDPTDDAAVAPSDLNVTNQTYGRRFKVVSFRWLTRSDI